MQSFRHAAEAMDDEGAQLLEALPSVIGGQEVLTRQKE
jgi:hypothetical protein